MKSSNEIKYETTNPVVARLIGRFFRTLEEVLSRAPRTSMLDVGCGEGEPLERLGPGRWQRVEAVDLDLNCVDRVGQRLPEVTAHQASAADLPFDDDALDLVVCLEVLEHLDGPEDAVAEMARVSACQLVVSVPYEPWFRLGNLLRGRHPRRLGNHPEHVNQFRPATLRRLLEPHADVEELKVAFPWLICRARVRQPGRPE